MDCFYILGFKENKNLPLTTKKKDLKNTFFNGLG
jgi:hypothetical protein